MEYLTHIARDQDNIFLSSTMTGNLQLLRLEHIGYFRYNSRIRLWEAVLCNQRTLVLKRNTNAERILSYHPYLVQISQSYIINVSYLVLIKGNTCRLLPPFDTGEELQISKSFIKKLMEKYPTI
ncbi:LytTR family transcriptional regulator DNA-binding domain-containing protein [Bacteroides sp.]